MGKESFIPQGRKENVYRNKQRVPIRSQRG